MATNHMVGGQVVAMTAQEEADFDASRKSPLEVARETKFAQLVVSREAAEASDHHVPTEIETPLLCACTHGFSELRVTLGLALPGRALGRR